MSKNKKTAEEIAAEKEFNVYFRKHIANKLGKAEALRKNVLLKIKLAVTGSVTAAIAIFIILFRMTNTVDINFIIFVVGAVCSIPVIMGKMMYQDKVKEMVLRPLLSFIGNFEIEKNQNDEYVKSLDLFDNYNRFSMDDRLIGKYGKLDIDISELRLTYKSGGKHSSTTTIFSGLLIVVPSLKNFSGKTIVRKKGKGFFSKFKDVNLEDPEFMKLYKTFSTDQVEARYLLTTAFMDRMVKLDKKMADKIIVSFEQNNVNIALESSKDWFEVPLYKPANDINNYREIISDLKKLLEIIDSLNLQSDIGL